MADKESIFKQVAIKLHEQEFRIISQDDNRPWGGFMVIDETQAREFARYYFPGEEPASLEGSGRLSPKILIVAPNKRLSWQYHHRRSEIWKCIEGKVGVVTSDNDEEDKQHILLPENIIRLKQGERHRLVGMNDWGIVAEIWQHTDPTHPSDEDDIVRVQDDFGR